MRYVQINVGALRFVAQLEDTAAPRTCKAFSGLLPLRDKLVQARWSGEAAWVPLGNLELGLQAENISSRPAPGDLLLYPRGISECEVLFPYGMTLFASRFGPLAGNHFATVVEGFEQFQELGRLVLWDGAQDIAVTLLSEA